jgi:hypothetical protein
MPEKPAIHQQLELSFSLLSLHAVISGRGCNTTQHAPSGITAEGKRLTAGWGGRHGSVDQLPFQTMGSGSLCAMAVFEAGFKDNLEQEDVRSPPHPRSGFGFEGFPIPSSPASPLPACVSRAACSLLPLPRVLRPGRADRDQLQRVVLAEREREREGGRWNGPQVLP